MGDAADSKKVAETGNSRHGADQRRQDVGDQLWHLHFARVAGDFAWRADRADSGWGSDRAERGGAETAPARERSGTGETEKRMATAGGEVRPRLWKTFLLGMHAGA